MLFTGCVGWHTWLGVGIGIAEVTYRVDHEHALHDVPERGAEGVWQGVIHPLHYGLEQPCLILGPER